MELAPTSESRRVAEALAHINRRRARFGEQPLDPAAAEWTDDDVIAEAQRTGWLGWLRRHDR